MKKFIQRHLTALLIWTAVCSSSGVASSEASDREFTAPKLTLQILNPAQTPNSVLIVARTHVERIFRHAGIDIEWMESAQPVPTSINEKNLRLAIVIALASKAGNMAVHNRAATGLALGNVGEGARRAYVFADRAEPCAQDLRRNSPVAEPEAEGVVLGHVIAHEVGHLLLPPDSHSVTGIMQARMDLGAVYEALRERLVFTSQESASMRRVLKGTVGE